MFVTEYDEKKVLNIMKKESHENSYKNGFSQGMKEGLEMGSKKGSKKGNQESLEELAKKMKDEGHPISLIEKFTGLDSQTIAQL